MKAPLRVVPLPGRGEGLITLLLFLLTTSCFAQTPAPTTRPHVLLILCDALTLDQLHDNAYPHLYHFAETNAIGLMNCAVAGEKSRVAAMLTLATGQHTPAEETDDDAANDWETVPGESGTAREVWARRMGQKAENVKTFRNGARLLGIAPLARRGLARTRLGALLVQANPPVSTFVCGSVEGNPRDRSAALLTMDANGVGEALFRVLRDASNANGPPGMVDDVVRMAQLASESEAEFTVVQLGDTARAEARRGRHHFNYETNRKAALKRLDLFLYLLTGFLEREGKTPDVLLVSPRPPAGDARHPTTWNRLTPLIAAGPDFPPGLLASATTRTPGLVANVDIAPTVLHLFRAPVASEMIGRPLRSVPYAGSGTERLAVVSRMDYVTTLNYQALTRAMPPLGVFCFFVLLSGFLAYRAGGVRWARWCAPGLVAVTNIPVAFLLAPILIPPTLVEYGLRIVAWAVGLAVADYALARLLRVSPALASALLTVLLVVGDTLTGQILLKDSLLSGYALSGIRYYGVGNEYLGVTLGLALIGGFALLDERGIPFPPDDSERKLRWTLILLWLALAFLLGWPGLGANAGSLAATGAGFGVGIVLLRGGKATVRLGALCVLAGLGLAFAFGALEAALNRHAGTDASSHFGAALSAASGGRGAGYLAEIALRKVAMNLRLLVSPGFLAGLAGLAGVVVGMQATFGAALRSVLERHVWLARSRSAALAAIIAALIFKDSGVVTAIFLCGAVCVFLLYYALTEESYPLRLESPAPSQEEGVE